MEILIDDSVIHYEVVHPEGVVPVVVLHGWGQSGYAWHPVATLLPSHFRIYLVDLPGFGQSPLGDRLSNVFDYASLIALFIEKLCLKRVVLIGHSFGAQTAAIVASHHAAIERLILVAPALKRRRHWLGLVTHLLGKLLPAALRYRLSSGLNYTQASRRMKQVLQRSISMNVEPLLPQITAKTLMVWGERDREILGVGKEMVNLIPHARLKVIYDAGHNLHLEKTQELARILERFLSL